MRKDEQMLLPEDVRVRFETAHVTGLSQWLVTNFLSAEFIRRQYGGHGSRGEQK